MKAGNPGARVDKVRWRRLSNDVTGADCDVVAELYAALEFPTFLGTFSRRHPRQQFRRRYLSRWMPAMPAAGLQELTWRIANQADHHNQGEAQGHGRWFRNVAMTLGWLEMVLVASTDSKNNNEELSSQLLTKQLNDWIGI